MGGTVGVKAIPRKLYLHVPLQLFKEVLFALLSNVQLLTLVQEVVVLERWQILGLQQKARVKLCTPSLLGGRQVRRSFSDVLMLLRDRVWGGTRISLAYL